MNYFLNDYNLVLWLVVISFWSAVFLLAHAHHQKISPRLMLLPACFVVIGMAINQYHPRWGTYMIALIHIVLLPVLMRIAKTRS